MKLNTVIKKVGELRPADYNPRKISAEQLEKLKKSLEVFGYIEPVVWNKTTETIVGGHQRVKAMLDLGMAQEELEVVVVELDDAKERALNLALNKISGEWDNQSLATLLDSLSVEDIDLSGFSLSEVSQLIDSLILDAEPEDDDAAPGVPDVGMAQEGDVYILGHHRLMCGSATNLEHVTTLMNGKQSDLVFTDPPYNVNYEGSTGLKIENDHMGKDDFYKFLYDAFVCMFVSMKPGAAAYIAHADSEGVNFRSAFEDSGFDLKQCIIWVKNALVMGRQDYHWQHEPILYGWKPGAAHTWYGFRDKTTVTNEELSTSQMTKPQMQAEIKKLRNQRNGTVVYEDKPSKNDVHPTMKPVALVQGFIGNSSKRGDIVLDPFGGSGSTLIACENMNRVCYTMELDPRYVDVIIERWEKKTGEKAVKAN